jgi:hypothetical protein
LGDQNVVLLGHNYSSILGTQIITNRQCTTFVNNLSIMNIPTSCVGLPFGSIYRDSNCFLKIVG